MVVGGRDHRDGPVDDDRPLERLVEDLDLRATAFHLDRVPDHGRLGGGHRLVERPHGPPTGQQGQVLAKGEGHDRFLARAGLRRQQFVLAVREQLRDPVPDRRTSLDVDGSLGLVGVAREGVVGTGEGVEVVGEAFGADEETGGLGAQFAAETVTDGTRTDGAVGGVHGVQGDQPDVDQLSQRRPVGIGHVRDGDAAAPAQDRQVQLPGRVVGHARVPGGCRIRGHLEHSLPDVPELPIMIAGSRSGCDRAIGCRRSPGPDALSRGQDPGTRRCTPMPGHFRRGGAATPRRLRSRSAITTHGLPPALFPPCAPARTYRAHPSEEQVTTIRLRLPGRLGVTPPSQRVGR